MAIDPRMSQREYLKFTESTTESGEVVLKVANADGSNIALGDVEIGAVEIKDHDSDTRVEVNGSNQLAVAEANSTAILADTTTIAGDTTSLDGKIAKCDTDDVSIVSETPTGYNDIGNVAMYRRNDAVQATVASADATSATQVVAKVAAKNIYVTDVVISTDTALNVQLQDDAAAVLMEQIYLPAVSVWSKTFSTPLLVATNQDLDVIASVAGNISVTVTGYQV